MEQYLLFVILGIVVILIIKRSFSNYYPTTPVDDYTPKIYQDYLSKDVANPSDTTYVIPGNPNDKNLTRLAINNFIWDSSGNVTINGTTYPTSSIWGYRKELTIGGGGDVWYILMSYKIGGLDRTPPIIDMYVAGSSQWAIPQFVLVQKSQVSPIIECATNAVYNSTSLQCVCKAGYWGTGDPNATNGNPLGCNICPVGSYCLGGASQTACPTGTSIQGAISQNACGPDCTPANPGGTKIAATTSSAAVCQCIAGYAGTGTTCNQCQLGSTYSSVNGAASCSAVTSCSTGYSVSTSATIIADNICSQWGPYTLPNSTKGHSGPAANTSFATLPGTCSVSSTMAGVWVWKVPTGRIYTFAVTGANGSQYSSTYQWGKGAIITAQYNIPANTYVYMVVGQNYTTPFMGGGGSFVFIGNTSLITATSSLSTSMPFIAAGGGGSSGNGSASVNASLPSSSGSGSIKSSSGNGGQTGGGAGGTAGGDGGSTCANGGYGILNLIKNGFVPGSTMAFGGGGQDNNNCGGGGGGYNGGGGGWSANPPSNGGGGGGSAYGNGMILVGMTNTITAAYTNGSIVIS